MERILRKKFVCISMGIVSSVLILMAVIINLSTFLQINTNANEIIQLLVENDGRFPQASEKLPPRFSAETPYATRFFAVKLDHDKELIASDTRNIHLVNAESAMVYAQEALDSGKNSDFIQNYKYQIVEQDFGTLLIFLDCAQELSMLHTSILSSAAICLIAMMSILILLVILSKKAVAPIVESYQKQQQFITNITHELKTPLAIIKTNTEVLEMEHDSSNWTDSIHNQISRLNELVNYLVSLSKLEEDSGNSLKVDFSISDAIEESVQPFLLLAQNNNKQIDCTISSGITYCGDEQSIRLLISILMENAIKYSTENSTISITLKPYKNRVRLEVKNAAKDLSIQKYDLLFERFYRMEASRNSKSGGFGIGLAMAKTIVKNHNGSIKAESNDGKHMLFKITL